MIEATTETDRAYGRARDFDVNRRDEWVGIFEKEKGAFRVHFGTSENFPLDLPLNYPAIRLLDDDRILVVDTTRITKERENAHIFRRTGEPVASFCAGDDIVDIVILEDLIAITYSDEGIFGGVPPSEQCIAFFDFRGQLLWGYRSMMGFDAVEFYDCDCACRVDRHVLAFLPCYPLVQLAPRTRTQRIDELPSSLEGATALSMRGPAAFFYEPDDNQRSIFRWLPGHKPEEIGKYPGPLRGLEWGRFLSLGYHGFTAIDAASVGPGKQLR